MPELPELEVVREVLERRLLGRPIERVTLAPKGGPLVVRDLTTRGFILGLTGQSFTGVQRRGKFLVFHLTPSERFLVVNPKLSGRLQLCPPDEKKAGPVHVVLHAASSAPDTDFVARLVDVYPDGRAINRHNQTTRKTTDLFMIVPPFGVRWDRGARSAVRPATRRSGRVVSCSAPRRRARASRAPGR